VNGLACLGQVKTLLNAAPVHLRLSVNVCSSSTPKTCLTKTGLQTLTSNVRPVLFLQIPVLQEMIKLILAAMKTNLVLFQEIA
jgi:hypothetical protein